MPVLAISEKITLSYLVTLSHTSEIDGILRIDPFEKRVPLFVCSRDHARGRLREFFHANANSTQIIEDRDEMERGITEIKRRNRYANAFEKLRERTSSILKPFKLSFKAFGVGVSYAAASRAASDNSDSSESIIYIKQDQIDQNQIVRLASFYRNVPVSERPLIFFEPDVEGTFSPIHLTSLNENIEVKVIGNVQNELSAIISPEIDSVDGLLKAFINDAFSSCIRAEPVFIDQAEFPATEPEEIVTRLSAESLAIKAYDHIGNKFAALPTAASLLKKIDAARDHMKSDLQKNYLLSLRAVVNLWMAYIDENYSEGIDNSAAIAEYLNNNYLRSHCLRLAHLVSGYSSATATAVNEAVKYFDKAKDGEAYIYSRNNYLLNEMHTVRSDADGFCELADLAASDVPYLDRLSTILNNAGTACLLAGDIEKAFDYYTKASTKSGHSIHHIGLDINRMICRYLNGDRVESEAILRLHRKIVRNNLPPEYDYHQSYMHWTLLKLSDLDPDISNAVLGHLAEKRFMDYDSVLEGDESMVDFLSKNMRSARVRGRFPGPRGDFIHRTEVFPIIHFSWM